MGFAGLQHGVIHPAEPYGLPTTIPLISNHLFDLGYRCHKVGKWHLGFYTDASCPWNRGFGSNEGSDYGYLQTHCLLLCHTPKAVTYHEPTVM